MVIAFLTSITLLPALLSILQPPGEPEPLGYAALAPVDRFLERHRVAILAGTGIIAIAGTAAALLPAVRLQPDQPQKSVRSSRSRHSWNCRNDPATGTNSIDILAPSLAEANAIAARLAPLPEVSRTMTLNSLVPAEQPAEAGGSSETRRKCSRPHSIPTLAQPDDGR